jgi:hypothetical protein
MRNVYEENRPSDLDSNRVPFQSNYKLRRSLLGYLDRLQGFNLPHLKNPQRLETYVDI